jgi:DNA-binding protein WhiA
MSFSTDVKEELITHTGKARHCQLAGLAVIFRMECILEKDPQSQELSLFMQTDNVFSVRKCFTILKKAFNIDTDILETERELHVNGRYYKKVDLDSGILKTILMALKEIDGDGTLRVPNGVVSPLLLRSQCCKRAFLRDLFICSGSISDPTKSYHMEFVCDNEDQAHQLLDVLEDFSIKGRMIHRKKYCVVYLKEGEEIVDLLNIMEAHVGLMNLENLRILKDMRNSVNRRVNCETANIAKTATAASRQMDDIMYIEQHYGIAKLSEGLRAIAEARLEHPEATLSELGGYLSPPVGKSGVNHRLRKLSELADKLRG